MSIENKEKKNRILFVVEAMGGGVFTYITELANALVTTYDICIAYGTRPETPEDLYQYLDKHIELRYLPHLKREISLKNDILALKELKKIAADWKPELIHLHSSKAGVLGRIAFGHAKIPFFYTPHGYSFLMTDISNAKRWIYRSIERFFGNMNCMTICCGEGEYEEAKKITSKATYIKNGINVDQIREIVDSFPATGLSESAKKKIFTIGRICTQKNPRLFNRIAEAFPEVQFQWIGDGELRCELSASNISVTGWLDYRSALQQMNEGDIFLLTSLWEGLPLALLEAMYLKKICLVSDSIGNREVIRSGENGYVCYEYSDYVKYIKEELAVKSEGICECACRTVTEDYNMKVMARRYREVYEDFLSLYR